MDMRNPRTESEILKKDNKFKEEKPMRNFFSILVIFMTLTICLFAKGKQEEVTEAPEVVTIMTWENEDATYSLLGEQPVIEYVEKKLNIKIDWRIVSHAERETVVNLMIAAGGEMPDIFPSWSNVEPRILAEKGIIIPWSDMMDAGKMPLTKAKFNNPRFVTIKNQMIDDETGKMYALPTMMGNELSLWTDYVRGDWLKACGIKKDPETIWEYRDMLRAFKTMDPNGNGKADEMPWANFYEGTSWIKMFSRMFDLPTPDYSLSTVDTLYWAITSEKKVVFSPTDERFLAMLEYLNELWEEGLIDNEQFNMTSPKFVAAMLGGNLGAINHWPGSNAGRTEALREIDPDAYWHAIPYVIDPRFMKPEDRKYARCGGAHNPFLLSAKGKNTEAAVRLMDFIFGDEELVTISEYGIEGVHHYIDENGHYQYIGKWAELQGAARYSALGMSIGHLPHEMRRIAMLQQIDTDPIYDDYKAYYAKIEPYVKPAYLWELTAEQKDITRVALKTIKTYVDECITKFVIGSKSFDEWDEYVETVNKEAGAEIEAARKVYQSYFDEFVKANW